jgi:hypothetical protein
VVVEDADAGLQVEYRALASESVGDDAVPLAGVPTGVITHSADPTAAGERARRRARGLGRLPALLAGQAVNQHPAVPW